MADTSRGRVTITLGRSGQVVKRSGTGPDAFSDTLPSSGSKRSVRERLGSNGDRSFVNSSQLSRKRFVFRSFLHVHDVSTICSMFTDCGWAALSVLLLKCQRGDIDVSTRNGSGADDVHIGKDDLRYILLRKNSRRRVDSDDERNVDLREKLVKAVHHSASATVLDSRHRLPERRENGVSSQSRLPPSRSANDLPRSDSLRNSYSPWTLEHIRQRSPERYIRSSRGLSPRRNMEELQRRPVMRTPDDVRSVPYVRRDVHEPPRAMSSASYLTNSARPTSTMRPPAPPLVGHNPPPGPGGSVQRSTQMVTEHQTVDSLLNALELGKYSIIFKAEEVDMAALKQMGEHDLKELGIPMGPRKKILQSIQSRPKRQQ